VCHYWCIVECTRICLYHHPQTITQWNIVLRDWYYVKECLLWCICSDTEAGRNWKEKKGALWVHLYHIARLEIRISKPVTVVAQLTSTISQWYSNQSWDWFMKRIPLNKAFPCRRNPPMIQHEGLDSIKYDPLWLSKNCSPNERGVRYESFHRNRKNTYWASTTFAPSPSPSYPEIPTCRSVMNV